MKQRRLAFAAILSFPLAALAAQDGEQWEITMNVPGMPSGMGGMTQQVCQDKDPKKQVVPGQQSEECKITDQKQSGNKIGRASCRAREESNEDEDVYNAKKG